MAQKSSPAVRLLKWCGMALVAGGVLMAVATLLHPSRETATTIIASEVGLVAAHFVYTLAGLLVLLGLPGLYVSHRGGMGRLGLIGFLTAFAGPYLIAVTGTFGFFAPVLAKESPATLDAIGQYWPVAVIDGLAAITFITHPPATAGHRQTGGVRPGAFGDLGQTHRRESAFDRVRGAGGSNARPDSGRTRAARRRDRRSWRPLSGRSRRN
jgi:hypothetical protein